MCRNRVITGATLKILKSADFGETRIQKFVSVATKMREHIKHEVKALVFHCRLGETRVSKHIHYTFIPKKITGYKR